MVNNVFDLLNTLHETVNDTVFENETERQEFNARVCFRLRLIKLALERAAQKEHAKEQPCNE